jgi:predicted enzyme related to lactoylglutathione lyase
MLAPTNPVGPRLGGRRQHLLEGSVVVEMSSHRAGQPCWVDVSSPDVDASIGFYSRLFGWDACATPDPQAGGYTMFRLRERDVAAVGPLQDGEPPAWSTYFATEDASDTALRIREAGGTVLVEPFDVMDAGRMAIARDPTGAVFGLWQAGTHPGAQIVDEPGSFCWSELVTRDADRAIEFYGRVFGWSPEPLPSGDRDFGYRIVKLDGRPLGRVFEVADRPPRWAVYFRVQRTDAATTRTSELGGSVQREPFDSPYGRIAVLADPAGATFSVITRAPSE